MVYRSQRLASLRTEVTKDPEPSRLHHRQTSDACGVLKSEAKRHRGAVRVRHKINLLEPSLNGLSNGCCCVAQSIGAAFGPGPLIPVTRQINRHRLAIAKRGSIRCPDPAARE